MPTECGRRSGSSGYGWNLECTEDWMHIEAECRDFRSLVPCTRLSLVFSLRCVPKKYTKVYTETFFFRPQKVVWHGSSPYGVRLVDNYCEAWRTSHLESMGYASPLSSGKILEQNLHSCASRLIVLCIENSFLTDVWKKWPSEASSEFSSLPYVKSWHWNWTWLNVVNSTVFIMLSLQTATKENIPQYTQNGRHRGLRSQIRSDSYIGARFCRKPHALWPHPDMVKKVLKTKA